MCSYLYNMVRLTKRLSHLILISKVDTSRIGEISAVKTVIQIHQITCASKVQPVEGWVKLLCSERIRMACMFFSKNAIKYRHALLLRASLKSLLGKLLGLLYNGACRTCNIDGFLLLPTISLGNQEYVVKMVTLAVGELAAIINILTLLVVSLNDRLVENVVHNFSVARLHRTRRAPIIHDSDTWLLNIPRSILKYFKYPGKLSSYSISIFLYMPNEFFSTTSSSHHETQ